MYLYDLPSQKKNVPELIKDPVVLIKDVRNLVERHCKDSPELAITGLPILHPDLNKSRTPPPLQSPIPYSDGTIQSAIETENNIGYNNIDTGNCNVQSEPTIANIPPGNSIPEHFVSPQIISSNRTGPRGPYKKNHSVSPNGQPPPGSGSGTPDKGNCTSMGTTTSSNAPPRRRRTRCKICEACQRSDCGECSFCLDMVKFGGPGRAKQTCMMRQCLQPMLPVTAQCVFCNLDGWRQTPVSPQAKLQASLDGPSGLMECSVCYEISHPDCAQKEEAAAAQHATGVVNEDLPNSWECPSCCISGKNNDYKVSIIFPKRWSFMLKLIQAIK